METTTRERIPPVEAVAGGADELPVLHDRNIARLARDLSRDLDLFHASCLDIGCGRSRYDQWYARSERAVSPREYLGVDADPAVLAELREAGVSVCEPGVVDERPFDLVLALEILEHLDRDAVDEFLDFVRDHTGQLAIFTTPNGEYWDTGRWSPHALAAGCRWLPDHITHFDPTSTDPHVHKHLFSPDELREALVRAFPPPSWAVAVYRAWPWRIEDLANDTSYTLSFKIFAAAWRVD